MIVLVRQLVMQNQIWMAAMVLKVYFIRNWKVSEEVAAFYMRKYFEKYYAAQVRKFCQHFADRGGDLDAKNAGSA
ncbi:hypothetical protein GE107_01570 [Cohnella sp. CFH 77786]|nr:hypothetical protein [Cohnella sp. CFH 77786]